MSSSGLRHSARSAHEPIIEVDDTSDSVRKVSKQRKSSEVLVNIASKRHNSLPSLASLTGDFATLCQRESIVPKLVVIGGGHMGTALVRGLMSCGMRRLLE